MMNRTVRGLLLGAGVVCISVGLVSVADGQGEPPLNSETLRTVTLSATASNIVEAAGASVVRATLSGTTNVPVTVWLAFSGTAWTNDYTRTPTNSALTIAADGTSASLTLKAVQDTRYEGNETIIVSIVAVSNAVAASPSQVAVTILDDDPPPVVTLGYQTTDYLAEGYGVAGLVASLSRLSEFPVTVSLSFSGSAVRGVDYRCESDLVIAAGTLSGGLIITAAEDDALEGQETITVDIESVQNGTESGVQQLSLLLADNDQPWIGIGCRVAVWTNATPADRVRLGVRVEGPYRVEAGEIAAAAGIATNEVLQALASRGLALTCRRRSVAWATDGEALYFYGVPTDELFAPENVYWLSFGSGANMEAFLAEPETGAATNAFFMRAVSFREAFLAPWDPRDRRSSVGTLTNVSNFGEWIQGTAAEAARAKSRIVELPGFAAEAATGVTVRVSLASYCDFNAPDNHQCEVWLNSALVGSQGWSGEQAVTFDFAAPVGFVTNGPVALTVRNGLTVQTGDFLLVDPVMHYPSAYAARAGRLLCTGGAGGTVVAEGFGSDGLRVWDVTEPDAPAELDAPVWQDADGYWRTAFACGSAATRYAVFDVAQGCLAPSVRGVRDTDWFDPAETPECAIVVPPGHWVDGFAEAVRPLAAFRQAQGLRTRVIDAEDIYNAFSDGLAQPEAFVRFCAAGVTNGAPSALKYLLFAGYASSDYKLEVFRLGEQRPYPALFPLLLFPQVEASQSAALMLPNDHALGDVGGGAEPEVAVGRFLATNAVELAAMVDKTIRYELTAAWKRKAIFTADWQNVGDKYANFTGISSNTATRFEGGGWTLARFFPGPNDSYLYPYWENWETGTGAHFELQAGSGFFYYVGHSSDTIAGSTSQNKLFDSATFKTANWPFAPVAVLMGCRMGRWTLLDLREQQQCIAEAAVRNRDSAFVAAISSAGYSTTGDAALFSYAFGDEIMAGARRLGDAWLGAFESLGHSFSARSRHIALLGDPALCLSANETARGTPTAWLIARGLTGDPYADLADQDGDAFATWQEYQAGTDPARAVVRIRAFAPPSPDGSGRPLIFEPIGGRTYRVVSCTNLADGVWQPLPWRPDASADWSWSGIPAVWPILTVEVPADAQERRRFYKVEAIGE